MSEFKPNLPELLSFGIQFRSKPIDTLNRMSQKGTRTILEIPFLSDMLNKKVIILSNGEDIREVLRNEQKNTHKKTFEYRGIQNIAGDTLLTIEGGDKWEEWHHQRKLAQPSFSRDHLESYTGIVADATTQLFDTLEKDHGNTFVINNLSDLYRHLTLQIISKSLFGHNLNKSENIKLGRALNDISEFFSDNIRSGGVLWKIRNLPLSVTNNFTRSYKYLMEFAELVVGERLSLPENKNDLLQGLISDSQYVPGDGKLSKMAVKDNIITFFVAGHATTTAALTWTTMLLSQGKNRQYVEQIRSEAENVCEEGRQLADNVKELKMAQFSLEEGMRLYPPAWIITRRAYHDFDLDNFTIRKGTNIIMVPYLAHRDGDEYDSPDEFKPKRFADKQTPPTFAFGFGPRSCIGRHFAMSEGPYIITELMRRYDLSPVDVSFEPKWSAILRPLHPIQMQFDRRK